MYINIADVLHNNIEMRYIDFDKESQKVVVAWPVRSFSYRNDCGISWNVTAKMHLYLLRKQSKYKVKLIQENVSTTVNTSEKKLIILPCSFTIVLL